MTRKPPIFIGGASRSGTTLLRVILDSHPQIVAGPEFKITPVLGWLFERCTERTGRLADVGVSREGLAQGFRDFFLELWEPMQSASGKPRLAEKTPDNAQAFGALHEIFPESPMIHVIRDGRDVIASLLSQKWLELGTDKIIEHTRDLEAATKLWVNRVNSGKQLGSHPTGKNRYFEIRYEDIVQTPEVSLKPLFDFLEEPWDPGVLSFHEIGRNLAGEPSADQVVKPLYRSSMGRWTKDLKAEDKPIIKDIAGDLLLQLGYATDCDW
jgi:hypothetical protein